MATKLSEIVQSMSTEASARGLHTGGSPYTGIGSVEVEVDVDLSNQDKWGKSQVGALKIKCDVKNFSKAQKCFLNIGVLKEKTTIKPETGADIKLEPGRLNFSLTNLREFAEMASVTEILDKCKEAITA